ncbi:TIGR02444 family protein [Congregibacter variabilis]|uniref:TIGR02444 family protein n=1 Tax=Congregibacter variabilis TaxID=3081200 RepID=A0ABZ0I0F0_9GAMM|nr:TIGR02444 family protein [Congregibacter sp. IMCC43200]
MDLREQTYEQEELSAQERLWRFATAVYAKPGVAQACIAAQEEWAVDVNLMLYVSWCAREARRLGAEDIRRAQDRCGQWRERVILPLRQQRVAWREQKSRAVEYAAIKQLELDAERTQLDLLATLSEEGARAPSANGQDSQEEAVLLLKHLQVLAAHYGLPKEAFGPFLKALNTP